MRILAWFLLGFLGMAGIGLVLNSVDIAVWPVAVMTLVVGALIVRIRQLEAVAMPLAFAYLTGFGYAYLRSFPLEGISSRMVNVITLASGCLLMGCAVSMILSFMRTPEAERRRFAYAVSALCLGMLIGYVSGDAGGAGSMRGWLRDYFSPAVAEGIVWTSRKTVHVVFYGVLAFAFYRSAKGHPRAALLAAAFALSHGVFDETRQSFAASRLGTPIDLLFDGFGIVVALALAKRK